MLAGRLAHEKVEAQEGIAEWVSLQPGETSVQAIADTLCLLSGDPL